MICTGTDNHVNVKSTIKKGKKKLVKKPIIGFMALWTIHSKFPGIIT